jgi:hypothetical protein
MMALRLPYFFYAIRLLHLWHESEVTHQGHMIRCPVLRRETGAATTMVRAYVLVVRCWREDVQHLQSNWMHHRPRHEACTVPHVIHRSAEASMVGGVAWFLAQDLHSATRVYMRAQAVVSSPPTSVFPQSRTFTQFSRQVSNFQHAAGQHHHRCDNLTREPGRVAQSLHTAHLSTHIYRPPHLFRPLSHLCSLQASLFSAHEVDVPADKHLTI